MSESNNLSETNRTEKTMEKFWSKVGTAPYKPETSVNGLKAVGYDGDVVTLDSKAIKTPSGFPLVVPSYKNPALVHLIAQEWSVMPSLKIKPHAVPLTSLAARAVDLQHSEEGHLEQDAIVNHLLPYLDTDTLLVFSPVKDCDGTLRKAQDEEYRPIIKLAEKFWGVDLNILDTEISLFGNKQSDETRAKVVDWIKSLDTWKLAALERATTAARSLIAGMLIVTDQLSPEEVSRLVDLETTHQTAYWGEVEDTHDVQHFDIRRLLGSSYLTAH